MGTPSHRTFEKGAPDGHEETYEQQRRARSSRRIRGEHGIAHGDPSGTAVRATLRPARAGSRKSRPPCGKVLELVPPGASVHPMQHTDALAMMRMMPPPPEALR
ncbi:hypothetical protein ACFFSH_16915 [Streptomyces filamentosus]|uniref:Uncharacterized protein n=1 Tax=Streptomyces filamentosus TaxID=67294 RepID=A0A919BSL4_STRFL|nr:hypothetical protein [Streptomyces filamentosus]GHG07187.1 hypothetical protein GCM10017667_43340 [Streptomyces filamentosus]